MDPDSIEYAEAHAVDLEIGPDGTRVYYQGRASSDEAADMLARTMEEELGGTVEHGRADELGDGRVFTGWDNPDPDHETIWENMKGQRKKAHNS